MPGPDEKQKVVIGGLANIADTLAKRVLAAYNPAYSYNTNLTNVSKCNTKQLEACAELVGLKPRSDDEKGSKLYRNKDILSDRIILKIESLFEAECSDCKSAYQNSLTSTPLFTCRLCLLGSHDCEEIKQRAADLGTPIPAGFVWICQVCLEKNNLDDMSPPLPLQKTPKTSYRSTDSLAVINEEREEGSLEEEEETHDEDNHIERRKVENVEKPGDRISPRRGRDDDQRVHKPQTHESQKKKVCELYKRRSCPHGRSGKKVVSGNPYPHS